MSYELLAVLLFLAPIVAGQIMHRLDQRKKNRR